MQKTLPTLSTSVRGARRLTFLSLRHRRLWSAERGLMAAVAALECKRRLCEPDERHHREIKTAEGKVHVVDAKRRSLLRNDAIDVLKRMHSADPQRFEV